MLKWFARIHSLYGASVLHGLARSPSCAAALKSPPITTSSAWCAPLAWANISVTPVRIASRSCVGSGGTYTLMMASGAPPARLSTTPTTYPRSSAGVGNWTARALGWRASLIHVATPPLVCVTSPSCLLDLWVRDVFDGKELANSLCERGHNVRRRFPVSLTHVSWSINTCGWWRRRRCSICECSRSPSRPGALVLASKPATFQLTRFSTGCSRSASPSPKLTPLVLGFRGGGSPREGAGSRCVTCSSSSTAAPSPRRCLFLLASRLAGGGMKGRRALEMSWHVQLVGKAPQPTHLVCVLLWGRRLRGREGVVLVPGGTPR